MEARHEFSYTFDEAFIRRALRRDHRWKFFLGPVLLGALLLVSRFTRGYFDPGLVWFCLAGIAFLTVFVQFVFRRGTKRIFDLWSKQSPEHVMTFRLDDEGFFVVVKNGETRYAWSGLRRLWRYDDVWLIEIVKNVSVFFPPDRVPDEARAFVEERCRAAGVRT